MHSIATLLQLLSAIALVGATPIASTSTPKTGSKGVIFRAVHNSSYNHALLSAGNGDFNIFAIPEAEPCPAAYKAAHPGAKFCHTPATERLTVFKPLTFTPGPLMLNTVKPEGGQQVYFNSKTGTLQFVEKGKKVPKGSLMEFFNDDLGHLSAVSPAVPADEHPVACGDPRSQEPLQIKFPVGTTVPDGCGTILFQVEEFDGFGAYRYGM